MIAMTPLRRQRSHPVVRAGTLALSTGNEQIISMHSQGAGIPLGGNEAERNWPCSLLGQIDSTEDRDRVQRSSGHEDAAAIRRLGECIGITAGIVLSRKIGGSGLDNFPGARLDGSNRIRIG